MVQTIHNNSFLIPSLFSLQVIPIQLELFAIFVPIHIVHISFLLRA